MPKCFRLVRRSLNAALLPALALAGLVAAGPAPAGQPPRFAAPALVFGMTPDEAAAALGVPLTYVRGHPGNELFLAIPNVKGAALSIRSDGLYLQFRRGRLTGWKGDWGTAKPFVVGW
jgi:hypothetical protein